MKLLNKIILIITFLFTSSVGFAQNPTNTGKDFWVAYGHHQFMETGTNTQEMVIYINAIGQTARVRVSINGTPWFREWIVPANSVISTATATPVAGFPSATPSYIPKLGFYDCRMYDLAPPAGTGGEGVYTRGIHIESDVPVVAYAHTFGTASSGATMLMPVETWGYAYSSINSNQQYASNCFSWAYVVSQHDNTTVQITPSVLTRNGRPAGVPFTVTLNRGEVYQVIGANPTGGSSSLVVTGTKFKSIANGSGVCYPIAVFSGSSRTSNPISCGSGGGDNDNQQLFPTLAWGKRYLVAPTSRTTAPDQFMRNSYKIVPKETGTTVKKNNVPLVPLSDGTFFFESNTADLIEADKPVMVAQFMTGGACMGGGDGDPEMIIISPLEQGTNSIGFFRNNAEGIHTNYLTMIIPTNGTAISSLTIDGVPFPAIPAALKHSYPHPQLPGYTVVIRKWSGFAAYPAQPPGQCLVKSDSAFTAITYGLGSVESYGYNAGTMIKNLSAVSSIQNTLDPTVPQHAFTCINTPMKLSVLMAYPPTYLEWNLSLLAPDLSPAVDVIDNAPVATGTVIYNGNTYYKYTLPGTYQFSTADTFYMQIKARHPSVEACNNLETLKVPIIVKDKPKVDFTTIYTGCTLDTANFSGVLNTADGFTLNKWDWTFPGPVTSTGQNIKKVFAPGVQSVKLSVVTTEGCAADTTKMITVNPKPTTSFTALPASICEGSAVTMTPISNYADPALLNEWYWDYGNGNVVTATTGTAQNFAYPAYGTYTIKQVVKYGNLCISDTAQQIVTVNAKPVMGFTYPIGCLPVGDVAQFNSTATIPDGQTFTSYSWNFGDPNATPANPNTSTLANPTHIYSTYGNYTINFSATTSGGCTKDTTVQVVFEVRPQLAFTPLNNVCENQGVITLNTGSVTNAVPGTHEYKGAGIVTGNQFHPDIAGPGDHTIWYVFTSNAGCKDSLSQVIHVNAKPRTSFDFPLTCLPVTGTALFTNTTTIPDGQTLTYLWIFNDPNANAGNPNTSNAISPSHIFTEGSYNINLQASTANGCVKDTTITIVFGVSPAINFPPLTAICQNFGAAPSSVAQASITNGVTGTGLYSGPGTTVAGMFDPNIAGPGIHTITYTFTSTKGCIQTATQTIEVYPRPVTSFNASAANICLQKPVTLSNTSTVASGTITTWNWDLGNGSTPTLTNGNPFDVSYSTANNFTIKLITVSDRGCISEPFTRTITVNPLPVADFTLPAGICMPGGQAAFTNTSTVPGNSSLSYQWSFGDGGTSTASNPTHVYPAVGSYNVRLVATSAAGCIDTSTIKVLDDFYDKPVAAFEVSPQEICQGDNTLFIDRSTAPNSTLTNWSWTFGDGTQATIQTPVKKFNNPGVYPVTLTVTNAVGCVSDPSPVKPVTVHLQPQIDAGRSFVVAQGSSITFEATANSQGLSFEWTPATNLNNPNILKPTAVANQDQRYTLTATGDFGCTATDFLEVKIFRPVKVPNVFSPNGDGIHDKWVIANLSDYSNSKVEIFNRYGQSVFVSTGYGTPWDGTVNGKILPVGTYYYVIMLENGFQPITGSVTIVK